MPTVSQKSIRLTQTEQHQAEAVGRLLDSGTPVLESPAGDRIELPETVFQVLKTAVRFMSHGQAIALVPENKVVSTQRAAEILGMSRPFFIKLLDTGAMAHHRVGNQRRVYLRDVLEFESKRDQARMASLDRLAREAFEAGLYERNAIPEGGSDE